VKGKWQRKEAALAVTEPGKWYHITVPLAPEGSYELQFKFMRLRATNENAVVTMLPVGPSQVVLVLGGSKATPSWLGSIDGKWRNDKTTAPTVKMENGREYAVHITVLLRGDQCQISVALDGKPFIRWEGKQSALSAPPRWKPHNPKCLGLGAHGSIVIFKSARLRMLSGKAKMMRTWGKPKKK